MQHGVLTSIPRLRSSIPRRLPYLARCSSSNASTSSDAVLRPIFDDSHLWRSVTAKNIASTLNGKKGLFRYPQVTKASDLPALATRTLSRAQTIVKRINALPELFAERSYDPAQALLSAAKQFDRLSDLLCGVIDLCEFIRNVHPDQQWILRANEAYELLCSYMNELNTHVGLYQILVHVLKHFPQDGRGIDPKLYAAYQVSVQFVRDFEKSGIHLPDQERHRYVELSNAAIQLGREFTHPSSQVDDNVYLSEKEVTQVNQNYLALPKSSKGYALQTDTYESHHVLRYHPSAEVRKKIWTKQNSSTPEQIEVLENLLRCRALTAQLVGKASWAEVTLSDKMARDPESVMNFLRSLSQHNAPQVKKELALLSSSTVAPWDREYQTTRYLSTLSPLQGQLSPYFSVGTVIQGLSRLFTSIFGVSFEFQEPEAEDELLWHPTVRKLVVRDEDRGVLGYMYCDLFGRQDKPVGAAHYTVRCARRTDDDDSEGDLPFAERDELERNYIQPGSNDRRGMDGRWQLPTIVLSCDFDQGKTLSWTETETLFHEVGHAIHSMLGQTEYQNVSGTRCATDFVELPSILMEHFCSSSTVLQLFARNKADTPLPLSILRSHQDRLNTCSGLEQANQIVLAALDQAYHSSAILDAHDDWNATESWYNTNLEFGPKGWSAALRERKSCWPTRFMHLVGYGATYYSYLLDRAIAGRVWQVVFEGRALNRDAGERYRQEVLSWGGGREPWECVAGLLQDDALAQGGPKAMQQVGQWGIERIQPS